MRHHRTVSLAIALCALPISYFAAVWTPQCRAEDPPAEHDEHASCSPQERAMEKRRDAILAEIEAIKSGAIKPAAEWGAEWAGDYHGGYGRYYIAPQSGCVYTHFSGCDGGLEFHHGDIIETTPEGVRLDSLWIPFQSVLGKFGSDHGTQCDRLGGMARGHVFDQSQAISIQLDEESKDM